MVPFTEAESGEDRGAGGTPTLAARGDSFSLLTATSAGEYEWGSASIEGVCKVIRSFISKAGN